MAEVIISNPDEFEESKKAIIDGGIENFHVLADFDGTLTKCYVGGAKSSAFLAQFRNLGYLGGEYARKAHALFDTYHPMEIDTSIPKEKKKDKMEEWWKKHFDLLIASGLSKEVIKEAVTEMIEKDALIFREGVEEFLIFLKTNKIPLVIMSSSIGDAIIEFMKQKGVLYDNIIIIANILEVDKDGKATGVKDIIHILNKTEKEVDDSEVKKRKKVLLLGNVLGDLGMVDGFEYDDLITIGFLNEKVEENLDNFKEFYDVVLLGDGDFSFVNDLVKDIK